jgi:Flp pilus assembly protein TadB
VFICDIIISTLLLEWWWFFVALNRLTPPFIQFPKKKRRQVQETAGSRNGADQKVKLKHVTSALFWIHILLLLLLLSLLLSLLVSVVVVVVPSPQRRTRRAQHAKMMSLLY